MNVYKKYQSMIMRIWDRGQAKHSSRERVSSGNGAVFADLTMEKRIKPRFCVHPDDGSSKLTFQGKEITHYDFVWTTLGQRATLLLYQGQKDGHIMFGAVPDKNIKQIGRIMYIWNPEKREFIEKIQKR